MYQQESFGQAFKRGWMSMPAGIRWLITINTVIYLIQILTGPIGAWVTETFKFIPEPSAVLFEPWRIVTYMFLHGSPFHIIFNMLWLWWLGRVVEDHLGTRNFLVIFLGAGIGGALLNVVVASTTGFFTLPTIGASGGVFGIMVAFAILFPTYQIMLIFLPPIQARFLVAGLIAIDLIFLSAGGGINRLVHLGGAFWGWALLKLYRRGYNYDAWIRAVESKFSRPKFSRPKSSKKVFNGGPTNKNMRAVADAEILEEEDQNELDRILEKISKGGYEALTDKEKRTLFELSKKN